MKNFVSFVLPCLNEEKGIGPCLDKIRKVIENLSLEAEIIVVDNGSTDKSPDIAGKKGAKIIYQPQKGYGAACLTGLREARGNFIIIGDADDSYNFLESPRFIEALREGNELVMGSRLKGEMLTKSMPTLNKIGNIILSGMVKLFFKTRLSDIHCGLRGLNKEAFKKMELRCKGMEFASEMVFSALRNNMKIKEIPITYYPRKGTSKLSRFRDAWRHIRFILLYAPTYLYFAPGAVLFFTGMALLLILLRGPIKFLFRFWDIHLMVLASLFSNLGFQLVSMGLLVKAYGLKQGLFMKDKTFNLFFNWLSLEKGLAVGFLLFLVGLGMNIWVIATWIQGRFGPLLMEREALFGATFIALGIQTIFFSFFFTLLKKE